ncbi:carbon-nitrogen hydrolase family protein [Limnobacter humi]|uniref:Carbon-nitrogen hydrolase family protein n=1 Tax=Limnobacter humi TaxID=1778671 RepID=A0ABT1WHK6_9BURK|nr:carbon-nitrogen hydrolase family protein [Limnobacter humi]MCQ8896995.1 carbon-nitrogen hydrolase family protein [Limnobacter humi]
MINPRRAVRVAALQMISTPVLQQNLDMAERLVQRAAAEGAELLLLPEYFCLMGHKDTDKLAIAEAMGHGPIQTWLSEVAASNRVNLVAGTLPLKVPEPELPNATPRVFNSSLAFDSNGRCVARYDKIHLFCFHKGTESYDEARVLKAGDTPVVAELAGLNVGLSVCYDLRFPELYRRMGAMAGALDLILMPAAFTYTTGHAHWEVLMRARAIENQCYVLACGQGGLHPNGRRTYGHSMLVNAWGEVEAVQVDGEGVVMGTVDPAKMMDIRASLPALTHRVL